MSGASVESASLQCDTSQMSMVVMAKSGLCSDNIAFLCCT